MSKIISFYSRFKLLIILTNLSTVYVPGLPEFPNCNPWIPFSILGAILPTICGLDVIVLAFFGNVPMIESIGLLFLGCSWLWNSLKRLLFLTGSHLIQKAIVFFDTELEPPFWPELREIQFQKLNQKILRTVCWASALVLGPMFFVTTGKLFFTKVLFFRSFLDNGNHFENTDLRIILVQGISVIVLNASWIMSEAFIALLMGVIITEYEFLTVTFQKIMNGVDNMQNLTENDLKLFRKQFGLWIAYHGKVIKFTKLVENFYVPILLGSLISLTVNFIGNIFNSITIKMPFDVAVLTYVYALPRLLVLFKLCQYGDKIKNLSENLFSDNIPENFSELPKDVMKSLLIIGEMTQRPALMRINNSTRLDSATFRSMLYVLYRFATFLNEMQNRTKKNQH